MAEEVLNLQLVSVQVDETDEVDGMRFSTFSTNRCGNWSAFSWESGRCLTVRILAFPKTERGCLLSDILERKVPDSYFLSDEKVKQLTLRL